jgi:hypothetical protein
MQFEFKPNCDMIGYPNPPIDYLSSTIFRQNASIFDLNFWYLLWDCFYISILSIRIILRFIYVVNPILLSFRIIEFLSKFPALWFYLQCFPFIQRGLLIIIMTIQTIVWGICWVCSLFYFFPIVNINELQNTYIPTIERVCFLIHTIPMAIGFLISVIVLCIFSLLYIMIIRNKKKKK